MISPTASVRVTLSCYLLMSGVVSMVLAFDGPLLANAVDRKAAQESGAQALRDGARFPWYDASNDRVKPVELRPYRAPRKSIEWEWTLRPKKNWGWGAFWDVVQVLVWVLLAIVFAALLFYFLKTMERSLERAKSDQEDEYGSRQREADRIENLPFQVKRPRSDLLGEARRLYQTGDYQEAIIYLFSYQLVKLDEFHFIRLAKGKTNRQYLGELRGRDSLRPLLSRTMLAFEDVFFGHYSLSKDRFESCWEQLDDFHEILQYKPPSH